MLRSGGHKSFYKGSIEHGNYLKQLQKKNRKPQSTVRICLDGTTLFFFMWGWVLSCFFQVCFGGIIIFTTGAGSFFALVETFFVGQSDEGSHMLDVKEGEGQKEREAVSQGVACGLQSVSTSSFRCLHSAQLIPNIQTVSTVSYIFMFDVNFVPYICVSYSLRRIICSNYSFTSQL